MWFEKDLSELISGFLQIQVDFIRFFFRSLWQKKRKEKLGFHCYIKKKRVTGIQMHQRIFTSLTPKFLKSPATSPAPTLVLCRAHSSAPMKYVLSTSENIIAISHRKTVHVFCPEDYILIKVKGEPRHWLSASSFCLIANSVCHFQTTPSYGSWDGMCQGTRHNRWDWARFGLSPHHVPYQYPSKRAAIVVPCLHRKSVTLILSSPRKIFWRITMCLSFISFMLKFKELKVISIMV